MRTGTIHNLLHDLTSLLEQKGMREEADHCRDAFNRARVLQGQCDHARTLFAELLADYEIETMSDQDAWTAKGLILLWEKERYDAAIASGHNEETARKLSKILQ